MSTVSGYWGHGDNPPPEAEIIIHSCGRQKINSALPKTNRPHGRRDYQLIYISKGRGYFYLNDAYINLKEGTILLYAPDEPQIYHYDAEQTNEIYYIHFSGSAAVSLLSNAGLISRTPYEIGISENISAKFERLIKELQAKPPLYRQCCAALFMELITEVSRKITINRHPIPKTTYDSILKMIEHMHENYAKNISVEEYAKMCSISKYYFSHCFKHIAGAPPISYRNHIRIEKSKEFLEENMLSVSEIALKTGFESAAYFSKIFKKHEGLSPLDYKQNRYGAD